MVGCTILIPKADTITDMRVESCNGKPAPATDPVAGRSSSETAARRPVRSFVLRGGRLTEAQERTLVELWPRFGIDADRGPLNLHDLFGNTHPVILEIGFGNGESTWQMAREHPAENFIGVEVHRPGVGHLLLKLAEHDIGNVRIACADAVEFLRGGIADASLAGLRLYFPDPWPKARHHKRRIVQPGFVALLGRKIAPGGILHMATDWAPYAEHMLAVMGGSAAFANLSPTGDACDRPPWRPQTKYERRGERLGHHVFDLLYVRAA